MTVNIYTWYVLDRRKTNLVLGSKIKYSEPHGLFEETTRVPVGFLCCERLRPLPDSAGDQSLGF